jgi:hypothetical protein
MNAICERLIGTPRREVLDRALILNQAHLREVLAEYQEHYSTARPHPGIGQRVPTLPPISASPQQTPAHVRSTENRVLGGLINEYERATRNRGRPRSRPKFYFRAAQVVTLCLVAAPFGCACCIMRAPSATELAASSSGLMQGDSDIPGHPWCAGRCCPISPQGQLAPPQPQASQHPRVTRALMAERMI